MEFIIYSVLKNAIVVRVHMKHRDEQFGADRTWHLATEEGYILKGERSEDYIIHPVEATIPLICE